MNHASFEDCPCCHRNLMPGLDTDRALVVAFGVGAVAASAGLSLSTVLCVHHARLANDMARFATEHMEEPAS